MTRKIMMNKKLIFLILTTLCLIFTLCACSCNDETITSASSEEPGTSTSDNGTDTSSGKRPDNQNPEPPKTDLVCEHYWKDLEISKDTSSTSSVYLKGRCYLCGDSLNKEAITTVTYEEWKSALSPQSLKSFTVFAGNTYTDYDESNCSSWRIKDDIHTEEYFIRMNSKNSSSYLTENYSGYLLMYNSFTYDKSTKTYVYEINEQSSIELGFADGNLIYHATVQKNDDGTQKNSILYLNHNSISVEVPQYFFDHFNKIKDIDALGESALSETMAQRVKDFLNSLTFDGVYEVAYIENGGLSVYFYLENEQTDPIFNESYNTVSIVAMDEAIVSLTIGNNTIDFTK